jgi:plastocyanin
MPSRLLTQRLGKPNEIHPSIQISSNEFEKGWNMMRKRVWMASLTALIVVAVALFAVGEMDFRANAQQTPAASAEVKIDNFSFGPAAITVAAGTTVTWTNHDDIPHTVVSDDKLFKSKVLDTDDKFSYTFSKPGTYPYFCSVHPKMTGEVVVQ